jgi:hypothetical protein
MEDVVIVVIKKLGKKKDFVKIIQENLKIFLFKKQLWITQKEY